MLHPAAVSDFKLNKVKIPKVTDNISEIREFIKKHKLNVKTSGKGRNKETIVKDIRNAMNLNVKTRDSTRNKNDIIKKIPKTSKNLMEIIPRDILRNALSFLTAEQRSYRSVVSQEFRNAVKETNNRDTSLYLRVVFCGMHMQLISTVNFVFVFCVFLNEKATNMPYTHRKFETYVNVYVR